MKKRVPYVESIERNRHWLKAVLDEGQEKCILELIR
ncbi:hypothetical protein M2454_000385 [Aequitasia blattaphilus]